MAQATRVSFDSIEWEPMRPGVRQKRADGMRLVEHAPDAVEEEWCSKGHVGYLVSGELELEFRDGPSETYRQGDGFRIPEGAAHKGHVRGSRPALMFLVDPVQ